MTNDFTWSSLLPALPELYLTASICVLLLADVFFGHLHRSFTATFTLLLLVIGAALTIYYAPPAGQTLLFSGMYVADAVGTLLKLAGFLFVAVALLYSRSYLEMRGILRGEYFVLALTALLGIFVMISAGSLLTVYMGVELLSLSLYAMVAFDRDSGVAAEAAIKYFVLGAIASGIMLYGMSMIYGLTGTLQFDVLAVKLASTHGLGLVLGVVFIVVAVAFKFGAVPFHMWVPDVYHGAPSSVGMFVATAPKLASFALVYRLLIHGLGPLTPEWSAMLAVIAVLSMALGNVLAIAQTNLKRMLAYSAIGNVGFILLGFVAATPQGYQAALYYTLVYVLMTVGSFGVILLAARAGFEADELDDYRGLHARDPSLALMMMVLMLSTAGIPPFVGFWAKLLIIQALWGSGHPALIIIAVALSVVGAFYYLRVIKLMYFDEPGDLPRAIARPGVRLALGVNAAAVLLLGLLPNGLLLLCSKVLS